MATFNFNNVKNENKCEWSLGVRSWSKENHLEKSLKIVEKNRSLGNFY